MAENDQKNDDKTNAGEIARVSIKVPPFWGECPEIWFAQVEAQFETCKVTSDITKFNIIVGGVESHVLAQVSEAVLNPPAQDKYDNFKKCVLELYSVSEQRKMRKLLSGAELGDRKPSHLLNELMKLAGTKVGEDFLRTIWLERLPSQVRAILSTSEVPLKTMATLADRIMDESGSSTVSMVKEDASASNSTNQVEKLTQMVSNIEKRIEKMDVHYRQNRARSRGRSRNRQQSRSQSRTPGHDELCWYHQTYGDKAFRCREPCSKRQAPNVTTPKN